MAAHSVSVVTFGEALLRLTVPGHGRLDQLDELRADVAGAELNVATGLASLGVPTDWVSAVPDSPIGRRVEAAAASSGVGIGAVARVVGGRLGVFYVEDGVAPRRISVWYDRSRSAFAETATFDFKALAGARFAVLSGITPGLGARSAAATATFITAAAEAGAELCIDVNYRERLWTTAAARRALAAPIRAAGVVVCSRRDAVRVFGCDGSDEAILAGFRRGWCPEARVVVLTLGSEGALGRVDGVTYRQAAYPAMVVDRFGAGDAFTAGLLWGLLGRDPGRALAAGAALAALKCSVRGDQARFTPAELDAVIDGQDGLINR